MIALKVTSAFADHGVGDTITDRAEMREVHASNPACVVRVQLSDEEAAAVKAEKSPPALKVDAPKADDKTA